MELSDEKVKNKQLEDRLEKIENEFENCKKELNTNQRLHSSLVRFLTKLYSKGFKPRMAPLPSSDSWCIAIRV